MYLREHSDIQCISRHGLTSQVQAPRCRLSGGCGTGPGFSLLGENLHDRFGRAQLLIILCKYQNSVALLRHARTVSRKLVNLLEFLT